MKKIWWSHWFWNFADALIEATFLKSFKFKMMRDVLSDLTLLFLSPIWPAAVWVRPQQQRTCVQFYHQSNSWWKPCLNKAEALVQSICYELLFTTRQWLCWGRWRMGRIWRSRSRRRGSHILFLIHSIKLKISNRSLSLLTKDNKIDQCILLIWQSLIHIYRHWNQFQPRIMVCYLCCTA